MSSKDTAKAEVKGSATPGSQPGPIYMSLLVADVKQAADCAASGVFAAMGGLRDV